MHGPCPALAGWPGTIKTRLSRFPTGWPHTSQSSFGACRFAKRNHPYMFPIVPPCQAHRNRPYPPDTSPTARPGQRCRSRRWAPVSSLGGMLQLGGQLTFNLRHTLDRCPHARCRRLCGFCGSHMHQQDVPVPPRVSASGHRVAGSPGDSRPDLPERHSQCRRISGPARCHADSVESGENPLPRTVPPGVVLPRAAHRGRDRSMACGRRSGCRGRPRGCCDMAAGSQPSDSSTRHGESNTLQYMLHPSA